MTPDSVKESDQIRLPLGEGKTSPVAAEDIARVIAALIANPQPHIGKILDTVTPAVSQLHSRKSAASSTPIQRLFWLRTPDSHIPKGYQGRSPYLVRYRLLLLQSVNLELALLIVAVPCIFLGRLQRRWWLIASAVFLPVVSWFSVLAEVAY